MCTFFLWYGFSREPFSDLKIFEAEKPLSIWLNNIWGGGGNCAFPPPLSIASLREEKKTAAGGIFYYLGELPGSVYGEENAHHFTALIPDIIPSSLFNSENGALTIPCLFFPPHSTSWSRDTEATAVCAGMDRYFRSPPPPVSPSRPARRTRYDMVTVVCRRYPPLLHFLRTKNFTTWKSDRSTGPVLHCTWCNNIISPGQRKRSIGWLACHVTLYALIYGMRRVRASGNFFCGAE